MQVNHYIIYRFSSIRREKIQKLLLFFSCFCTREEKPSVYLYVKIALSQYAGLWDRTYHIFDIRLSHKDGYKNVVTAGQSVLRCEIFQSSLSLLTISLGASY